jgi:hypothetical protein
MGRSARLPLASRDKPQPVRRADAGRLSRLILHPPRAHPRALSRVGLPLMFSLACSALTRPLLLGRLLPVAKAANTPTAQAPCDEAWARGSHRNSTTHRSSNPSRRLLRGLLLGEALPGGRLSRTRRSDVAVLYHQVKRLSREYPSLRPQPAVSRRVVRIGVTGIEDHSSVIRIG